MHEHEELMNTIMLRDLGRGEEMERDRATFITIPRLWFLLSCDQLLKTRFELPISKLTLVSSEKKICEQAIYSPCSENEAVVGFS